MSQWMRFLASLLLFTALHAQAASSSEHKKFFTIEAGSYMTNIKERLNAPDGYASEVSSWTGFLRFHAGFPIGKKLFFEPAFGTMLPPRKDADGSATNYSSHIDLNLGFPLASFLRFRAGPGVQWDLYFSKDGSIALGNGVTTTNFPMPDRTTHVLLVTVQGGFSLFITHKIGLYVDVYVPEVMSSLRRRYHATATLGYTF